MAWPEQAIDPEAINGDRRFDRRYAITLDLRWKLIRRRKVLQSGCGATVDLSSGGILFEAGRPLPIGLNVELSISWPALLHDIAPMQLVASGKIVRANGSRAAMQMTQHEFRTMGSSSEHRAMATLPARATPFYRASAVSGKFGTLQ